MWIAKSVFCWALSRAEEAVKSAAMETAAKPEYNPLAIVICRCPHAHFATGTADGECGPGHDIAVQNLFRRGVDRRTAISVPD